MRKMIKFFLPFLAITMLHTNIFCETITQEAFNEIIKANKEKSEIDSEKVEQIKAFTTETLFKSFRNKTEDLENAYEFLTRAGDKDTIFKIEQKASDFLNKEKETEFNFDKVYEFAQKVYPESANSLIYDYMQDTRTGLSKFLEKINNTKDAQKLIISVPALNEYISDLTDEADLQDYAKDESIKTISFIEMSLNEKPKELFENSIENLRQKLFGKYKNAFSYLDLSEELIVSDATIPEMLEEINRSQQYRVTKAARFISGWGSRPTELSKRLLAKRTEQINKKLEESQKDLDKQQKTQSEITKNEDVKKVKKQIRAFDNQIINFNKKIEALRYEEWVIKGRPGYYKKLAVQAFAPFMVKYLPLFFKSQKTLNFISSMADRVNLGYLVAPEMLEKVMSLNLGVTTVSGFLTALELYHYMWIVSAVCSMVGWGDVTSMSLVNFAKKIGWDWTTKKGVSIAWTHKKKIAVLLTVLITVIVIDQFVFGGYVRGQTINLIQLAFGFTKTQALRFVGYIKSWFPKPGDTENEIDLAKDAIEEAKSVGFTEGELKEFEDKLKKIEKLFKEKKYDEAKKRAQEITKFVKKKSKAIVEGVILDFEKEIAKIKESGVTSESLNSASSALQSSKNYFNSEKYSLAKDWAEEALTRARNVKDIFETERKKYEDIKQAEDRKLKEQAEEERKKRDFEKKKNDTKDAIEEAKSVGVPSRELTEFEDELIKIEKEKKYNEAKEHAQKITESVKEKSKAIVEDVILDSKKEIERIKESGVTSESLNSASSALQSSKNYFNSEKYSLAKDWAEEALTRARNVKDIFEANRKEIEDIKQAEDEQRKFKKKIEEAKSVGVPSRELTEFEDKLKKIEKLFEEKKYDEAKKRAQEITESVKEKSKAIVEGVILDSKKEIERIKESGVTSESLNSASSALQSSKNYFNSEKYSLAKDWAEEALTRAREVRDIFEANRKEIEDIKQAYDRKRKEQAEEERKKRDFEKKKNDTKLSIEKIKTQSNQVGHFLGEMSDVNSAWQSAEKNFNQDYFDDAMSDVGNAKTALKKWINNRLGEEGGFWKRWKGVPGVAEKRSLNSVLSEL